MLVDAAEVQNFSTDRYISNTVLKQLQNAELLIVNKIDLVSKEKLAELEAWLEEVSPTAFRLKTSGGVVPVEVKPTGLKTAITHTIITSLKVSL